MDLTIVLNFNHLIISSLRKAHVINDKPDSITLQLITKLRKSFIKAYPG